MADPKIGTFEDLLALTTAELRPVAGQLRALVYDVFPDAVEVVRLGDRAATYGLGPKKMSEGAVYVLPYDRWVNLGFYQGVSLPDPTGLLEGTGARMRHAKIRSTADVQQPPLHDLIAAAVAERRTALGRT